MNAPGQRPPQAEVQELLNYYQRKLVSEAPEPEKERVTNAPETDKESDFKGKILLKEPHDRKKELMRFWLVIILMFFGSVFLFALYGK